MTYVNITCDVGLLFGGNDAEGATELGDGFAFYAELDVDDSVAAPGLPGDCDALDDVAFKSGRDVVNGVVCGDRYFAGELHAPAKSESAKV